MNEIMQMVQRLADPLTSAEDYVETYQKLINLGIVWSDRNLGNTALSLVEEGLCLLGPISAAFPYAVIDEDADGNPIEGIVEIPSVSESRPGEPGTPEYVAKKKAEKEKEVEDALGWHDRVLDEWLAKQERAKKSDEKARLLGLLDDMEDAGNPAEKMSKGILDIIRRGK